MGTLPLRLACLSAGLSLVGCTSLTSYRDPGPIAQHQALPGLVYSLPMRQYQIVFTAILAQCENAQQVDDVKLVFQPTTVTARDIAGERYFLDYTALDGWTKATSFGLETYDNGTLKSVNASAEDKSAEIALAAVKTGLGIAALASGNPWPLAVTGVGTPAPDKASPSPAPSGPPDTPEGLVCRADTKNRLTATAGLKARVTDQTKTLADLTEQVRKLTERQPIYGLTLKEKNALSDLITKQARAAAQLTALQAELSKEQERMTISQTAYWPTRADQLQTDFRFSDNAISKLAELLYLRQGDEFWTNEESSCRRYANLHDCLTGKLLTSANLLSLGGRSEDLHTNPDSRAIATNGGLHGVYIRPPAPGLLLLCRHRNDTCTDDDRSLHLYRSDAEQIAQLGSLQLLPFKNKVLQNNTLSLSLRPNGSVEKFAYSNPKARGETAANLAADLASQWAGYMAARDQKKQSDAAEYKQAELDAIQHQIDLLTKQRQLDALVQPPSANLVGLQTERTMTEARTALLDAQLAELRAGEALRNGTN